MTKRIMHIAEVGLSVKDLPRSVAFYQEVLGLETVRAYPTIVFPKAGELDSPLGSGGHPKLLVIFDRQAQLDIAPSTLDHVAFEIPLEQFQAERERLQQLGREGSERIWRGKYAWLGARSLFLDDPDGNNVELIARDPNALRRSIHHEKVLKWIGIILGLLVGLVGLAFEVVYVITESRLNKTFSIQVEPISISTDAVTIERGQHVAVIRLCTDCHGADLAGRVFLDDPVIGRIVTTNLTSGNGGWAAN